jgi:hypothetical protein
MITQLTIRQTSQGLEYSTGQRYTHGELKAYQLLGCGSSTDSKQGPHDAGNEIIALAEQIKAERAIMAMEQQ